MFKQKEIVDFNSYKNVEKKLKIKHAIFSTGTIVLLLVGVIYTLRSIELIIALAVLTWLLKYSVKQIKVVYKTKKVVVLKLSKTR